MYKIKNILRICAIILIVQIGKAQSPSIDPSWQKMTPLSDDFNATTLDCDNGGVYSTSSLTSAYWSHVNSSGWNGNGTRTAGVTALAVSGNNVYAGTSYAQGGNGGVYNSSAGAAWTKPTLQTPSSFVTSIAFNSTGSDVYVGVEGGVNHYNGSSWTDITQSGTHWDVTALAVNGSNVFVGTYGTNDGGVHLYNSGTWTTINSGLSDHYVTSIAVSSTSLLAGTDGGGIFYSSNNGTSWIAVNGSGLTTLRITALALDGTTLIAGTNSGIFYSTNYSSGSPSWTLANSAGLTNHYITSLAKIASGAIAVGTMGGGVFYSANYSSGTPTWADINGTGGFGPLLSKSVSSLVYNGSILYAGVCPKWRVMDASAGDCCGNVNPSNVSIGSGILDLTDDNSTFYYCNTFDNGSVETYNANYGYGYYEISAKPPYTASSTLNDNFHPAFWFYYNVFGSACGEISKQEIDVFEPGGQQYHGVTNGFNYHIDDGSCGGTKVISQTYTNPSPLYSAYHKYGVEFGSNRIIYYFDDVPVYSLYNPSVLALKGLFQVQINAGVDNWDTIGGCNLSSYLPGDSIPAHFKIDYFNYYKLNTNCGTSVTVTNNTSGAANTIKLTGTNAYIPSVYSDITIAPNSSLSLNSSTDNKIYRGVNFIKISPTGTGSFSIPVGQTLSLIPTACDN